MPGQEGPVQQVQPAGGPGRRRQMSLLVGEGIKGHPKHLGEYLSLGGSRQETGHVGTLHRPGAGAGPHGLDGPQALLPQQRFHHLRQVLHMLKEGVALAQA